MAVGAPRAAGLGGGSEQGDGNGGLRKTDMREHQRHTLICTVGTSLFGRLQRLQPDEAGHSVLAPAHRERRWADLAAGLREIEPTEQLCGAEINSVADLLTHANVERGRLHLLVSETSDGEAIGAVLKEYFSKDGWTADSRRIDDLRDDKPAGFRTRGLRNLAKTIGELVRASGADYCAINATGGYKAQIAIAVLMGQALGIPVCYKHERFDTIIPFPPMPVSLDFSLWERASGMFTVLGRRGASEPWDRFRDDWDERFEPLVNRVPIDGVDHLELSATGQIFHETFRTRFQKSRADRLPRAAAPSEKKAPSLGDHGYEQAHGPILRHLQRLGADRPYVRFCHSTYWNPDLPESSQFRIAGGNVEGIYSNGSWCVKFRVLTTANEQDDLCAVVADLNGWLDS